jgi:hypothetical protein
VAAAYATKANTGYGNGIVLIATAEDLAGVNIGQGNVFSAMEEEVGVSLLPLEFADRASITISHSDARDILGHMGFNIPSSITSDRMNSLLKDPSFPRLTPNQITEFVNQARDLYNR